MTRTVADAALMLQAMAGFDRRDPCSAERAVPDFSAGLEDGVRGARLALARGFFFEDCDPEIAAAVEEAAGVLRGLGATVEEIELPEMHAAYGIGSLTIAAEAAAYHEENRRARPEAISEAVRAPLELGAALSAVDYIQAQRVRRCLAENVARAMAPFAAVLSPAVPVPATPLDDTPKAQGALRFRNTVPFNVTGLPAISVPCGFTGAGMPIGLQIAGRAFDEAGVLRVARAYEKATDWHARRPEI
jgi:aspartyl-tRNA(Asn)/glutamyl-tRNA(Gln) amidotransferase subunit A